MNDVNIAGPVAAFVAAINRHDEDAFLDAFTQEGSVDDWGRIFTGRDAIKRWSDKEFIGAKGTMTPEQVFEEARQTVVIAAWRSNWANGRSRFAFQVEGDKIKRMTIREG